MLFLKNALCATVPYKFEKIRSWPTCDVAANTDADDTIVIGILGWLPKTYWPDEVLK